MKNKIYFVILVSFASSIIIRFVSGEIVYGILSFIFILMFSVSYITRNVNLKDGITPLWDDYDNEI